MHEISAMDYIKTSGKEQDRFQCYVTDNGL